VAPDLESDVHRGRGFSTKPLDRRSHTARHDRGDRARRFPRRAPDPVRQAVSEPIAQYHHERIYQGSATGSLFRILASIQGSPVVIGQFESPHTRWITTVRHGSARHEHDQPGHHGVGSLVPLSIWICDAKSPRRRNRPLRACTTSVRLCQRPRMRSSTCWSGMPTER
jgi:hypothetical protein